MIQRPSVQSRLGACIYGVRWLATAFLGEACLAGLPGQPRFAASKIACWEDARQASLGKKRKQACALQNCDLATPKNKSLNLQSQFVGRFIAAVACSLIAIGAASACSVCFGDPNDAQTHGMNMAILTLLGVTGGVMAAVVGFGTMIALRIRRAELAAAADELGDPA